MASLTYWSRLEPRPRSASIARALAAQVRDPAWMLARQWQVGEFQGEDAASPAVVDTLFRLSSLTGWLPQGGDLRPLAASAPLEPALESEGRGVDLTVRVELGQVFESLLVEAGLEALRDAFRQAYPIEPVDEEDLRAMADEATARFLRVCGGRATDGVSLLEAANRSRPAPPDVPPLTPDAVAPVLPVLDDLRAWADDVLGGIEAFDPPAWNAEHLEYSLEAVATLPTGSAAALTVTPRRDGALDWSAFDLQPTTPDGVVPGPVETVRTSVLPTHVRFPGMPNARWWSFEDGRVDFGGVQPDLRDLGRVMLIDFALVHGNDWFVMPFEQPVGTVSGIEALVVHDVFGGATLVPRADQAEVPAELRWTMYSTATAGGARPADFFVLPAAAVPVSQPGIPLLEEVLFIHDEMANIAWAIERVVENGLGEPWQGHERDLAIKERLPEPPPSADEDAAALSYRIQTTVPEHWIPLLPVMIDPDRGDIALELGAMLRGNAPGGEPILPAGRILRPLLPAGHPYRLPEHEVSRSGTKAARTFFRTRWSDGTTYVWVARVKGAGRGEGTSGLSFDLVTGSINGSNVT
jgi:hypothetical protein